MRRSRKKEEQEFKEQEFKEQEFKEQEQEFQEQELLDHLFLEEKEQGMLPGNPTWKQPGEGQRRSLLPLQEFFQWDTGRGASQEFRSSLRCRSRRTSKEQETGSSRTETGTKTGTMSNMGLEVWWWQDLRRHLSACTSVT